jgi:branched-chain amino acid transport system ATP-binding protein
VTNLLEVQDLGKRFGGLRAVDNVSFGVAQGVIKSVIGPNGAGKTTLFNLVSGFTPCDSGRVIFLDQRISGMKPHRIAALGMARTFQHIRLFPHMSVLDNVMMGRHLHTEAGFISGMFGLPSARREERNAEETARELLDFMGIASLAVADATNLAYGQQRAVELARALACEPKLLLLDEPAAGLNMRETADISDLIVRIRDRGVTVLIVEHDMSLVMGISDEILVLSYGSKIAEDEPRAIQKNAEVIKVYLGDEEGEDDAPHP